MGQIGDLLCQTHSRDRLRTEKYAARPRECAFRVLHLNIALSGEGASEWAPTESIFGRVNFRGPRRKSARILCGVNFGVPITKSLIS